MRFVTVALVVLLCPIAVSAQVVMVQQRQCGGPFRCNTSAGTGVVIGRWPTQQNDNLYYVLTAAHLTGLKPQQSLIRGANYGLSVVTQSGNQPATIVQYDGQAYLMLLSFRGPIGQEIKSMQVTSTMPSAGQPVTIHGFSYKLSGQYGARSLSLKTFGSQVFETTSPFEQGESGGPVCDSKGQIIGLCEGFDVRTKIGFGPSAVAIRRFLNLPAIGASDQSRLGWSGGNAGDVPVRSGMPLPASSVGMSVPAPPIPDEPAVLLAKERATEATSGGVADTDPPAVHVPGRVVPAPEPDPISNPPTAYRTPLEIPAPVSTPGASSPLAEPGSNPGQTGGAVSTVVKVATAAKTGLDLWSLLAGGGLVAGTGGVGAMAWLAWKGFKAVRAIKANAQSRPGQQALPEMSAPVVAAPLAPIARVVTPPNVPVSRWNGQLPPHQVTFVDVPNDYRKASVDWALEQLGKPGSGQRNTAERFRSLINQHLAANGHASPGELHN